jgi:hypothetical protein
MRSIKICIPVEIDDQLIYGPSKRYSSMSESRLNDRTDATSFLRNAQPTPGQSRFMVGTFERGITLYRQQIRALNLIYALVEAREDAKPIIAPSSQIAIIGGGAFGVTAAAAAAYAGFDTILLEQQQELLHLQHGCDTRWVHPHFYDWPASGSDRRSAQLPILDWPAATGSDSV